MSSTQKDLYAQLYDLSIPDWPGEVDFYRELAAEACPPGGDILEIACGTGRITLRLAQDGFGLTGLDLSPQMLAVARGKSRAASLPVRWVEGDMRAFDLGRQFGLVIIPGHSFQSMLTPQDQLACLDCIRHHLRTGGLLVVHLDHQDINWLAGLPSGGKEVFQPLRTLVHPTTGQRFRRLLAWSFERATQTATVRRAWEELDQAGHTVARWEMEPLPLHCVFRFEMEHLLWRAGFALEAVYGDFFKGELSDASSEMIWLARRPPIPPNP